LARLQAVEVVGGSLRVGSGGKDGALVLAQNLEPARQIGGVIGAGLGGKLEVGAEEGSTELGDEFLEGIGVIAEAFAEFAGHAGRMAGPVDELMRLDGGVTLGVFESLRRGHLDEIAGGCT
jgi:hypothetical protein